LKKASTVPDSELLLYVHELHVEIDQSTKTLYPLQAVDLRVEQNTIVGLVGESGSGKSMTALAILRLLPSKARVSQGQILFNGQDLLRLAETRMDRIRGKQISIVFQNAQSSLNPVLSVGSQIASIYRLHEGGSKRQAWNMAVAMLDAMGIPNAASKAREYPHQYSGGMAQRAMIAMALVCSPRLLIADEPTSGLDVTIQAQVLDLIVEQVRQQKASLLLISHDMGVIAETCDEVVVMYAGMIMEYGPVRQVIHQPANPYTQGLMAAFRFEARERMYFIPGQVPRLTHIHLGCPFVERCSQATAICQNECPPLSSLAGGRYVACHHPLV
jgi:oligopeptide/dipeptide ABC transporter ATP-binding protein